MNELIEQMGANFNIPKLTLLNSPNLQHVKHSNSYCKKALEFKSDFSLLQSPRNGEDLSDAENETEQHDEMPRESSSPEDGHGGQVRVKVISHALLATKKRQHALARLDHKLMIRIFEKL